MSEYIGNRYEILKLIGKGGMADVYLAYDVILKREVAVKIMKAEMADDDLALERFKREAGAITRLSHPNIVDVYDVGDEGHRHYIVMEYVKGYTLKQLIQKRGPIPYKEAVWMMKQIAGALMEAHRNNVIHRDVKSQNVLIKDDGTIKLSDFGIAVAAGAMQITHKDSVLGSVHYLAPELSKGKPATMQSDIYSLGIVFYELLTGDVPFKADTPVQVALEHIRKKIPSVCSFDPSIPQSVDNIIIRATAKNPNNRYRNVALMLKDLNECLKKDHLNDPKVVLENEVHSLKNENVHIAKEEKEKKQGKPLFWAVFLITVTLLSALILLLVLFLSGVIGNYRKVVTVPDLTNKTIQEAKDILAQSQLEVDDSRISWILSDSIEKDLIISTNPAAGDETEIGTKVKLTVSDGIYAVLGNYVGMSYETARDQLNSLNFIVKTVPVDSDRTPGTVVEQEPAEGYKYDASKNNEITLKYAQPNSIVLSYDLKGMPVEEALNYFANQGIPAILYEKEVDYFDSDELLYSSPDTLIRTDPALGEPYTMGSDVEVKIYYYRDYSEDE